MLSAFRCFCLEIPNCVSKFVCETVERLPRRGIRQRTERGPRAHAGIPTTPEHVVPGVRIEGDFEVNKEEKKQIGPLLRLLH
jgi:hypothetical protein